MDRLPVERVGPRRDLRPAVPRSWTEIQGIDQRWYSGALETGRPRAVLSWQRWPSHGRSDSSWFEWLDDRTGRSDSALLDPYVGDHTIVEGVLSAVQRFT